jgi:hypothetical protein
MYSEQLSNSQATAELCLPDAVTKLCQLPGCPKPVPINHRGRPARFCSPAHKVAAFRAKHRCADVTVEHQNDPTGQWVTVMQRVQVGVKKSASDHKESVAKKFVVKPCLVWVTGLPHLTSVRDVLSAPEGSLAITPRKVIHDVDVNDRQGVSGDGRYTSPSNSYPPEEKLVRKIFDKVTS